MPRPSRTVIMALKARAERNGTTYEEEAKKMGYHAKKGDTSKVTKKTTKKVTKKTSKKVAKKKVAKEKTTKKKVTKKKSNRSRTNTKAYRENLKLKRTDKSKTNKAIAKNVMKKKGRSFVKTDLNAKAAAEKSGKKLKGSHTKIGISKHPVTEVRKGREYIGVGGKKRPKVYKQVTKVSAKKKIASKPKPKVALKPKVKPRNLKGILKKSGKVGAVIAAGYGIKKAWDKAKAKASDKVPSKKVMKKVTPKKMVKKVMSKKPVAKKVMPKKPGKKKMSQLDVIKRRAKAIREQQGEAAAKKYITQSYAQLRKKGK